MTKRPLTERDKAEPGTERGVHGLGGGRRREGAGAGGAVYPSCTGSYALYVRRRRNRPKNVYTTVCADYGDGERQVMLDAYQIFRFHSGCCMEAAYQSEDEARRPRPRRQFYHENYSGFCKDSVDKCGVTL